MRSLLLAGLLTLGASACNGDGAKKTDGASCRAHDECASGYCLCVSACRSGCCAAPPAEPVMCTQDCTDLRCDASAR